eukprot:CAMPEP_0183338164 /NCGR_PEP_ID=MMETSP0164_2-20130417/5558_1 /TAXON_ID=221442 /ORGANISM="Coccolithus pelagicus ssp braarudi, Strain PLY182g" /LENGTH=41 /DNA_ID= /DNA_START= /DNA_END= /DNA_ORIENTATION=
MMQLRLLAMCWLTCSSHSISSASSCRLAAAICCSWSSQERF